MANAAGYCGFYLAGPLAFLGYLLGWLGLMLVGMGLIWLCWLIFGGMACFCLVRNAKGGYWNLRASNWRNQVW